MAFLDSPGVKISEVDLSTTIPTEGVSDAAFVGTGFTWGPVDTAVTVSSEKELVRIFGKPAKGNKDWFTAASFLAYGGDLQIIRKIGGSSYWASDVSTIADGLIQNLPITLNPNLNATTAADLVDKDGLLLGEGPECQFKVIGVNDGSGAISTDTNSQGYLLNGTGCLELVSPNAATIDEDFYTRISGDGIVKVAAADGTVTVVTPGGALFTVTAGNGQIITSIDKGVPVADYGTYTLTNIDSDNNAMTGLNVTYTAGENSPVPNGSLVVFVDDISNVTKWLITTIAHASSVTADPGVSNDNIGLNKFAARYAGTSGNNIKVKVANQITNINDGTKKVTVEDSSGAILESYEYLSTSVTQNEFGTTVDVAEVLNQKSSYVFANTALAIDNATYTLDGGTETDGTIDYSEFNDTDKYDVDLIVAGGASDKALECATTRADCVAFVSPVSTTAGTIISEKNGFSAEKDSFGFMDSGSKKMYDKYNDGFVEGIPLNGDIAGLCVRTDNTREPWYSPAGFNRGQLRNVVSLTYDPSQSDRNTLYEANINPVSTFPGQGVVLFGDKTLQTKPSAFDRINVRRLFNIIEKTIKDVAKYSLFEFNDEFTRAQFRSIITPYLRDIQARRGITDFLVVCDTTNNPANIIDSNQFIGDIFIKPTRSVNFIQLNFVAVSTGVSFSEVIGSV